MTHLSLVNESWWCDDARILPPRRRANRTVPPCDCFAFKNPQVETLEENAVPHVSDTYEIANPCRTLLLHSRRTRFCFAWDFPYAPPQRQEDEYVGVTTNLSSPYLIKDSSSRGRSFLCCKLICTAHVSAWNWMRCFDELSNAVRDRLICGSWWSIDCQVHHPSIADPAPSFIAKRLFGLWPEFTSPPFHAHPITRKHAKPIMDNWNVLTWSANTKELH
jgi:hypothetical protein